MNFTRTLLVVLTLGTIVYSQTDGKCMGTTSAVKVVIKPNAANRANADIYLVAPQTGKTTRFTTLRGGNYQAAEFHGNHLYVVRRIGQLNAETQAGSENSQWTDELWRYASNGSGRKLWSGRNLTFRTRDDERLIAVIAEPEKGVREANLYLLQGSGKLAKALGPKELGAPDFQTQQWVGRYLWLKDQEAVDIHGFTRVDTKLLQARRYDLVNLNLTDTDWSLNTCSLKLAYSDYPVVFDVDSEREIVKSRTPTRLYVYDMGTKQRRVVAQATAKMFNPKWINSRTLEYDNPRGKGRIRKSIP